MQIKKKIILFTTCKPGNTDNRCCPQCWKRDNPASLHLAAISLLGKKENIMITIQTSEEASKKANILFLPSPQRSPLPPPPQIPTHVFRADHSTSPPRDTSTHPNPTQARADDSANTEPGLSSSPARLATRSGKTPCAQTCPFPWLQHTRERGEAAQRPQSPLCVPSPAPATAAAVAFPGILLRHGRRSRASAPRMGSVRSSTRLQP